MPLELGANMDPTMYAYLGGVVVAHLIIGYYLFQHYRGNVTQHNPQPQTALPAESSVSPLEADDIVECPHCGTANEADYRFCRACVGELGTQARTTTQTDNPSGRRRIF